MSPVVRAAVRPAPSAAPAKARGSEPKKSPAQGKASGASRRVPGAKKIVNEILPGFSRQLAAMLSAGMPIVASLEALEEQSDNPNFRSVVNQVKRSIENGASLSEALRQFPVVFDDLYANMVKGGETGGQLAETMARLAGFLESTAKLRRKIKSAMMYPTIVLCIAIAIAIAMIVFVVPVFGSMFADFGKQLPAPTQFLLDLSHSMRKCGGYIVLGLIVVIVVFRRWKGTPAGALAFDKFLLKVPVFGELNRKVASARFARTFGQMIRSGVPILEALNIVAGATGNKVASLVVLASREAVEKGDRLSSAMVNQTVFPMMMVRMLQAGEKTGKVDDMMDNIATFYEDEVDTMLAGLTSLLEPLLMIFLGVVIGGIVISMFLPIFKMGEVVSG
jgi:type IV pilus assembly protein PilC